MELLVTLWTLYYLEISVKHKTEKGPLELKVNKIIDAEVVLSSVVGQIA